MRHTRMQCRINRFLLLRIAFSIGGLQLRECMLLFRGSNAVFLSRSMASCKSLDESSIDFFSP